MPNLVLLCCSDMIPRCYIPRCLPSIALHDLYFIFLSYFCVFGHLVLLCCSFMMPAVCHQLPYTIFIYSCFFLISASLVILWVGIVDFGDFADINKPFAVFSRSQYFRCDHFFLKQKKKVRYFAKHTHDSLLLDHDSSFS